MTRNSTVTVRRWEEVLKSTLLPLLFLLMVTATAFHEVPVHEMLVTWDDQLYVTENPDIRGFDRHNITRAFSSSYAGNYAPVQILSYMLDYSVWGENPAGYFLANIGYHFISGVLLYYLLIRLGFQVWGAAIGTAVFLVHPVQVESVAWISQRKTLLAMLFYLGAFHAYLSYRHAKGQGGWRWYVASVGMFALALLSKSVAVIFPLMLMVYDLTGATVKSDLKAHVDKLLFFAAAAAVGLLAFMTQSPEMHGGRIPYPPHPWLTIPLTMLPVLVNYLRLLFWPDPATLCIMYFPTTRDHIDGMALFGLVVAAGLLMTGWYLYRKARVRLFWYLLFFLGLLPVAQIIPIATLMNERYLYFPLLGVAGLVAWGCDAMRNEVRWAWPGRAVITGVVAVILLLATVSAIRSRVWRNGITLFGDAVAKLPHERDPWTLLAESYLAHGDAMTARRLYEKAETLGPLGANDQFKLASIYLEAGELDRAFSAIWKLLLKDRDSTDGKQLLSKYYLAVSCAELKSGRPDTSLESLRAALQRGLSMGELSKHVECVELMADKPGFKALLQRYSNK